MKYKAIIVLLAICLTCLLPLQADAAQILDGGELRGGLTWSVDSTGTLTISGEGDLSTDTGIMDMASPWYAYFDRITTIVIEEGITSIDAMGNLTGLTTVILPESLKSIGYKAFSGCRSLTTIHLPGSLTSIGKNAFYGCAALNGMVIPEGVTAIGNGAFARCTGLQSVTIPVSVKKVGSGAFDGCTGLTDVYYTGTEAAWSGIAIEANNQHLLAASIHYSAHAAHNFTAVVTEPGCTTQGYTTYTCTCGEQYVSDVTEVRWHSYAWSSESNGIVTMVCTECGDSYKYHGSRFQPMDASNKDDQDYEVWTGGMKSCLVQNSDGTFTRVQYGEDQNSLELFVNDRVYIEHYDADLNFLSHTEIPLELSIFGGYYTDGNHHFLVFGDHNLEEMDDREVMRVVKYSLDWQRLGCTRLYGCNTSMPFQNGNVQMASGDDILYVRTCHRMYTAADGLRHQANFMLTLRISDMKLMSTDNPAKVSHSFNQLIALDGRDVILVDHGDAVPRTMQLTRNGTKLDLMVFTDSGDYHYNYTGASLGGLGVSDTAYLVAGNSIRQDGTVPVDGQRNIFLTVTDKGDFSRAGTTLEWLTHHGDNANVAVSTPHLVTVSSDRFCVLWTEDGVLHYTFINGEGQQVTEVFVSLQGMLSDCVPICADGKLIWYVSHRFKSSYACDYRFVKMFSIDLADPDLVMVKDVFYETQHLWSEWETVQEPGNGVHGLRERTCSRCGQTEQAEIPKLKHRPGDLNGDSRVNGLDLVLLRQYLADWAVEPDLGGADCNGDTRVNGLDLILLRQYLAGWDVRLAS